MRDRFLRKALGLEQLRYRRDFVCILLQSRFNGFVFCFTFHGAVFRQAFPDDNKTDENARDDGGNQDEPRHIFEPIKYDVFQAKSLPHCCQATSQVRQLAADLHVQGQGFGSSLLADALFLHCKDKKAAGFYLHHGFIALPDTPLTLLLPLATVPDPLGTK